MSPKLPVTTGRKMVKALEQAGFIVHHTTGSHHILRHQTDFNRRVTVPMHPGDLKAGTVRHILKQSGLSLNELIELL